MRPLYVPLAALALAAAGASLAEPLGAQERPRTPAPRERTRGGDMIVERGDGVTRLRSWGADESRAVLGVSIGSGDDRGVRVVEVAEDGPAARAGIEEGDRIVSINGTALTLSREDADDPELRDVGARRLTRTLGALKPGDEATLVVARGSERRTVKVKTVSGASLAAAGGARAFTVPGGRGFVFGDSAGRARAEATMRAWRDSMRVQAERRPALGLSVQASGSVRDTLGLFVGSITSGGPAEKAGLVEGERIAAINDVDVRVPREDVEDRMAGSARASRFTRELRKAKPGDDVRLRVWGEGRYRTVSVKVGRAADVFRNEGGMTFGFGDDGFLMLPSRVPMPALAPMAPMAPLPPMAPGVPMPGRVQIYRSPRMAPMAPAAPRAPLPPTVRTLRRWTDV